MIYLLYNPNCRCFKTVIDNMHYILTCNGLSSQIKYFIDIEEKVEDLWICIWNDLIVLPKRCVIYNLDPMVDGVYNSFINLLNRSNTKILKFIDYCYSQNKNKLESLNMDYIVIPYGYSSFYDQDKYNEKIIDILFIGGLSPRREYIFGIINNLCVQNGYIFKVISGVYNDDKINLINSSKIILSVSNNDAKIIGTNDLARISEVITRKGLVITEFIGDKTVENKLSNYIDYCSSIDEIIDKIKYYLEHEDERNIKIKNAYDKFKDDFNFEKSFLEMIKHNI